MNNKIYEEAMANMIRRIEILESQMRNIQKTHKQELKIEGEIASKAQIDYLRCLGGKTWEGMTKQEAGKGIDNLLNKEIPKKINEPKEVDTDDAGLDGVLL